MRTCTSTKASAALVFAALVCLKIALGGLSKRNLNPLHHNGCCTGSPQQVGLSSSHEFGCHGDSCWAGVYVDQETKEVLHLDAAGCAFLAPGTAAAYSRQGRLRWWAEEDVLHLVDCYDQPYIWPGAANEMRRDPVQGGKLSGFGVEVGMNLGFGRRDKPTYRNSTRIDQARLVRDPFGFLYPGCIYSLSVRPGVLHRTGNDQEAHVLVNRDGTVTNVHDGERIARWFFLGEQSLGARNDLWASGNTITLLVDTYLDQSSGTATTSEDRRTVEVNLRSSDGGRTWLPVSGNNKAQLKTNREAASSGVLSLVLPKDVSMFPLTGAMSLPAAHLNGDMASDSVQEITHSTVKYNQKLQPLYEVFETQPIRIGRDDSEIPESLEAIIVISRAVPKPTENINDLSCVFNGVRTRAVWLSWSMVLCSTASVTAGNTTVYIAFQDRRFSVDFFFLHTPVPRHLRLAWPATEMFVSTLNDFPQKSGKEGRMHEGEDVKPGMSSGGRASLNLVLCTMFKNEAAYLEEWLQYHQLLGVTKVYLYDNGSTDESRTLLRKYELSKFVHVRDWPYDGAQTEALNDCLCRFRHTTRWMSFIDVDEFIDPAPGLPIQSPRGWPQGTLRHADADQIEFVDGNMLTRRKRLRDLLEDWTPKRHTHCMAWVNHCSYGQLSKPPGGVLDNYPELENMGERKIHMQKPLFNAMESLTLRKIGPHFLLYATEDIATQYRRNLSCPYKWLDPIDFSIRHYRSKSLDEYVKRRTGPDSAYQNKRNTKERLALEWQDTNAQCGKG